MGSLTVPKVCTSQQIWLGTGHADGRVRVWQLQKLTEPSPALILKAKFAAHSKLVNCCSWNDFESLPTLASCSNDQNVAVVDADAHEIPLTIVRDVCMYKCLIYMFVCSCLYVLLF